LGVVAGTAIGAVAAGYGRNDQNAVAFRKIAHHGAELLDHAHGLVSEDGARLHAGDGASHEMQIRAADCRCGDADYSVGGLLNLPLGHILEADIADVMKNDGLHRELLGLAVWL
jgi:hypothetical protein